MYIVLILGLYGMHSINIRAAAAGNSKVNEKKIINYNYIY
jgi:hypothetical protein